MVLASQSSVQRMKCCGSRPLLGHGGDLGRDVVPGRAQAQHRAHSAADAGDGVLLPRALVVVGGATGQIGVEGRAEVGRGIVAAHRLAGSLRRGDLGQHLRVGIGDAREVHHLAQTDDARPGHRLGHVLGRQFDAGRLQPRGRWRAGRHLGEDVDRLDLRLVVHQAHAGQSHDVGDLVRVDEDRGRAAQGNRADELGQRDHAGLDVHVRVAKPRDQEAAAGVDDAGVLADLLAGVLAAKGEAPLGHGDVDTQDQFARVHVDPGAAQDDGVRRLAACRDRDQARCTFVPGFHVH